MTSTLHCMCCTPARAIVSFIVALRIAQSGKLQELCIITVFILCASGMFAANPGDTVQAYQIPGMANGTRFIVMANGVPIPTQDFDLPGSGCSLARFAFTGQVAISVRIVGGWSSTAILSPKKCLIPTTVSADAVTFSIDRPRKLVLRDADIGHPVLILVADAPEANAPDPNQSGVVTVASHGADATGSGEATTQIQGAIDAVPVGGTLYVGPGIYTIGQIELKSDLTMYLHPEALLRARTGSGNNPSYGQGMIHAINAARLTMRGHGVINGLGRAYWRSHGGWYGLLSMEGCSAVSVADVLLLDPCVNFVSVVNSIDVEFNNMVMLAPADYENTDGFDLSGNDFLIDDSLIWNTDATIAPTAELGVGCRAMNVRNCVLRGPIINYPSAEVTDPMVAMDDFTYENLDWPLSNAFMTNWAVAGANFNNHWYKNIRIESWFDWTSALSSTTYQARPIESRILVAAWESKSREDRLGYIHNVHFNGLHFDDVPSVNSIIQGWDTTRDISFHFSDFTIGGSPRLSAVDGHIDIYDSQKAGTSGAFATTTFDAVAVPEVSIDATSTYAQRGGTPVQLKLVRSGSTASELVIPLIYRGNAEYGVDYQGIPATATFASGSSETSISVRAIGSGSPKALVVALDNQQLGDGWTLGAGYHAMLTMTTGSSYTITAATAVNGAVTPSGATTVMSGGSQTYTITPATGYQIASLTVDGLATTIVSSYTFTNVAVNHTISATFSLITGSTALRSDGVILRSGQPFMPRGIYYNGTGRTPAQVATDLQAISAAGLNAVEASQIQGVTDIPGFFTQAQNSGLAVFAEVNFASVAADAFVAAWKDHPALAGWNVADDVHRRFTVDEFSAMTAHAKILDPNHLAYCTVYDAQPGAPDMAPYYGITDQYWGYRYPVYDGGAHFGSLVTVMDSLGYAGQPSIGIPQAYRWDPDATYPSTRFPNPQEYRCQVWAHLACGARGLMPYSFTDSNWNGLPNQVGSAGILSDQAPALWSEIGTCASEVANLQMDLLNGVRSRLSPENTDVFASAWKYGGWYTIAVVNLAASSQTASYAMPSDAGTIVVNPYGGRNITMSLAGGVLSGTLSAYETQVVRIPVIYTISAGSGSNGTVTPAGVTTVSGGGSQTYTITPATGYQISGLTVDGSAVTASGSYTFTNVTSNHTIAATFSLIPVATYTVTGTVAVGGTGLVGVTVSDGTRTVVTDADGIYVLTGVPAGTYTLTPSLSGYTFTPGSITITVLSSITVTQVFTATATARAIGSVRIVGGNGKSGCGAGGMAGMLLVALALIEWRRGKAKRGIGKRP